MGTKSAARRMHVYQGVIVRAVAHRWHDLIVDVAWRSGLRRIVFQFDDISEVFHHATTLARWNAEETVLTYVRTPQYSVLIDDKEAFRVAYDGD